MITIKSFVTSNTKKTLLILLFCLAINRINAQVPIAYYDFESNASRNTTVETTVEAGVSTIGSPSVTGVSLTASNGTGNGITYGGTNTGYSIGYYAFTTNASSASTDPAIKFGPYNCTGYSSLYVTMEVLGIGAKMPSNVDVYWSTNDITYNRISATTTLSSSFTLRGFVLPIGANGASTLYIKVVGFGAGASPTSTDGVMRVDNFTLHSSVITANSTLVSAVTHGTGLSSGGSYFPSYTSLTLNGSGITVNASSDLILGTTAATTALVLTNGIFSLGNNTLTFSTTNIPIAKTSGQLSVGSAASLVFGKAGSPDAGAGTGLPTSVFTTNPVVLRNLTFNRTNNFDFYANGFTIDGGSLTLTSGRVSVSGAVCTFQNTNTPFVKVAGTFSPQASTDLVFGTPGNTGGTAFTLPNNLFFLTPASANSITINRTNPLTLGNQNIVITSSLNLTSGTLNDAGLNLTLNGNITGTGTHAGTGTIIMQGAATAAAISGATLGNITLNNSLGFTLTGSPTITGKLTLTSGALAVGANTLTFHTNNLPIVRTSGTITLSTTSSLVFGTTGNTGGSAFTIPNSTFTSNTEFKNLTINRTNSLTLNNQNFALKGVLTITAGRLILPANYIFTLRSTSITNTALVGTVGATGSILYNSGAAFRVERYIPQQVGSGRRAYRDIAPSVNSGTGKIFDNWQEGGTNGLVSGVYYGTHITGVVGLTAPGGVDATTGLDKTETGAASLFIDTISTTTGADGWNVAALTTNQTNDTLSAFRGYRVLIRGNRLVDLYIKPQPKVMNAPATLRSTGKLVTGNVVFTTSGVTANGATNTAIRLNSASSSGFTMVGNPYACPVDWHSLYDDASTANISPTYTLYDPNAGTSGAYVTYNRATGIKTPSTSAVSRYIQPGQAIFIANTSTSPSITFKESHKAASTANLTATFRSNEKITVSTISIDLIKNDSELGETVMDGVAAAFNNSYSNDEGAEDAPKLSNPSENICILKNGKKWNIEGRKEPKAGDNIQLNVWRTNAGVEYKLVISTEHFNNNNELQPYLIDRFNGTETLLNIKGVSTYSYTTTKDEKSYNNRFEIVFKAKVFPELFVQADKNQTIKIAPNPVKGKLMNIQVNTVIEGKYTLSLFNSNGVLVYSDLIKHSGGLFNKSIQLPTKLSAGIYNLTLNNNEGISFHQKVVLE